MIIYVYMHIYAFLVCASASVPSVVCVLPAPRLAVHENSLFMTPAPKRLFCFSPFHIQMSVWLPACPGDLWVDCVLLERGEWMSSSLGL